MSPQINHYLSFLDTDILLRLHFYKQCICLKPTWISQYNVEYNLTASCLHCWSTGHDGREIHNKIMDLNDMNNIEMLSTTL